MSNHLFQVIVGKHVAVIHTYMFGVLTKGYPFNVKELERNIYVLKRDSLTQLETIHTSDKWVMLHSSTPLNSVKTLLD